MMKSNLLLLVLLCLSLGTQGQTSDKPTDMAIADLLEPKNLSGPSIFNNLVDEEMAIPTSANEAAFEGLQIQSIKGSKLEANLRYSVELHSDKFLILSYQGDQLATCHVTDLKGDIVFRYPIPLSQENTFLNMEHLTPGDYYLYIYSAGHLYREKFSKK